MYISESQLQEILTAIEVSSNNRDWWTIATAAISAVAAVVAIFISINTAERQNRIALYEKRLECYLQFSNLKSFAEFIEQKEDSPTENEVGNNKIVRIQNKYMDIHNLFVDKEFQRCRFDAVKRNTYILNCLEKDKSMLTSLTFLLRQADEESLCKVKKSLSDFIEELFKFNSVDIDITKIRATSLVFAENFSVIKPYETNLKCLLKLESVRGEKHDKS